jgi:hypothetical protein
MYESTVKVHAHVYDLYPGLDADDNLIEEDEFEVGDLYPNKDGYFQITGQVNRMGIHVEVRISQEALVEMMLRAPKDWDKVQDMLQ